ncbi:MAG: tryptophan/tyrosine permease [Gammaproteobacteria bacterium]|nr:tryptophan/tyrosine permease [Gammaproteobacteria bacterium]
MNKTVGCTLMITGTSIGGGMLALPVVTATTGFFTSSLLLIGGWFFMTIGALLVLEVNLWLRENNNLVSMSKTTLGKTGQLVAWISCCLLLYSVLCAYTAGGSDLLIGLFNAMKLKLPHPLCHIIYILLLGSIAWCGTHWIDYANRGLMLIKFISLLLLIMLIAPHAHFHQLPKGNIHHATGTLMVIALSFTYSIIIPSMRVYLKSNIKQLRLAILIGSLIPLTCYIAWDYVVQSTLPTYGANGLAEIANHGAVVGPLTQLLSNIANNGWLSSITHLFTSICMLTAFLAVTLSLSDFLADGFRLKKVGRQKWLIYAITFLPVILILTFTPHIFITALRIGGIFCVILVMVLPALMVWSGRYRKKIAAQSFRVWGGKLLLAVELVVGLLLISADLIHRFY